METRKCVIGALVAVGSLVLSAPPVAAEEVPFIAGEDWMKSARVLKRAYLIGMSNMLSIEYAYQKHFGPPPDKQTSIQRLYEGVDDVSLDGAIDKIDAWYKANPDKKDHTVLEVIWVDMVRPNLPKSRLYEEEGE